MRVADGDVDDSDLGGVGVSGLCWFVGDATVPVSRQETALPPWVPPGSGGPWVALGGAVLTVEVSDRLVERRLAGGELHCPGCGGVLARWGWARERVLRGAGAGRVRLRPRRARCRGCAATHVLLPVSVLLRRADLAEVIGAGLAARARGSGVGVIAVMLDRPADTVRGWCRRLAGKAEQVRAFFTRLLVDVGIDRAVPAAAGTAVADAVAAIAGAAAAVAARWQAIGMVPPWQAASAASGGRLLSPSWP